MALHTDGDPATSEAPRIDDELQHTEVTYGDVYQKFVYGFYLSYRAITVTVTYRYRRCFLTATAAAAMVTALQGAFDATGAAFTPPRKIATVTARRAYKCNGYDVEVCFADSVTVETALA